MSYISVAGTSPYLHLVQRRIKLLKEKQKIDCSTKVNYQSFTNFLIDETNVLWCGSEGGLCRVELADSSVRGFRSDDTNPFSISSNLISSLLVDRDKNLWIGTDNGLNRLSLKSPPFHSYSFNPTQNSPAKDELSGSHKN